MLKQQEIRDEFENCQYKYFLLPDYSENESVIIYKAHHSFTDGMGASMFFLMMSDQYLPTALPSLKPLSYIQQFVITLLAPFLLIKNAYFLLTIKQDDNSIHNPRLPIANKKHTAFALNLPLEEMKKYCKENNCTINDYTTALLSNSLYEYLTLHKAHGKTDCPPEICISLPYSMR